MDKTKVNYALTPRFDIGAINDKFSDGSIEVNRELWIKFCDARFNYEVIYDVLEKQILKKDKTLKEVFRKYNEEIGLNRKPKLEIK